MEEYFLLIALQLLGVGFHVMQKVISLSNAHPDNEIKDVFVAFWKADWDTVFVSGLVLLFTIIVHYIVAKYAQGITSKFDNYLLFSFALSLTMGYAGQKLIYKYLGTAEKYLDKKADDLDKKIDTGK
jgi:ABC-type spermidine/putrescine transport system permease subunit I